jgi:hypothetical protein
MAEPRVSDPRVGHDNLEPAGFGARPFHDDPSRSALECLGDERVAVVPRAADCDEDLARVEPPTIGGATGNFPIVTAEELCFREEFAKADGRNPLMGQSVDEPSCHRRMPPCLP